MNHSNLWISLDINKINSQLTLTLKQSETGGAIHISLTEDGRPYRISERCYAYLQALKTDSINPLSHPCTIENNTITYYVQPNMTSTVGRVECEVVLSSEDGQIIISPSFAIVVYKTVYGELEEEYEPEKNTLTQIITEANATVDSIKKKLDKGEFNAGFASEMNVSTTTGEAGTEASVEVTPDDSTPNGAKKFNFDFTIPRGDKGEKGDQGIQGLQGEKGDTGERGDPSTVKIGTVTTGKPNTAAKVFNSGTEKDAVLNFTLPIGEQAVRILTKAEFDALETKEDGIIYVFSDDDTWETSYKYDKNDADFSTKEKLFAAPAGCYSSDNVYRLSGKYTLLVCGNANNINQVVHQNLTKTILAIKNRDSTVYSMDIITGSDYDIGWVCLNNPKKATYNYGQSVDGVITIENLTQEDKTYMFFVDIYETVGADTKTIFLPPIMVRSHKISPPSIGSAVYYTVTGEESSCFETYAFKPVSYNNSKGIYTYRLIKYSNSPLVHTLVNRFYVRAYEI